MILVTRLNGSKLHINPELLLSIEETPDTVITLTDGKKYVVVETAQDLVNQFIEYKHKVLHGLYLNKGAGDETTD